METVPFDSRRWSWGDAEPTPTEHLGRQCVRLADTTAILQDVELADGAIELDLAVGSERGFPGVVWRVHDTENFESFYVRPHQVGNPDAVQYTPVFNGISAWQLYHGTGFWAPIEFPIDDWFTVRVVFSGARGEVYVGDSDEPSLEIPELKLPAEPGRVGIQVGGPDLHVSRFAHGRSATFTRPAPPLRPPIDGAVPAWWISDALPEAETGAPVLDPGRLEERTWTQLRSEPSGLVDLARVNGIHGDRNTTFARAVVHSARAQTKRLELGFSDRAVVYLNGRALYSGDDTYRSRDYRFLGSIGYYDTLYLPLGEGENELVVAVSEDFGGWGVQARFPDLDGLAFD